MHGNLSLILGWRLLGGRVPKAQQVSELKLPRGGLLFYILLPFSPCKDVSVCCGGGGVHLYFKISTVIQATDQNQKKKKPHHLEFKDEQSAR